MRRFIYLEKEVTFTDSVVKCFTLQSGENFFLLWIKSLCLEARNDHHKKGSLAAPR